MALTRDSDAATSVVGSYVEWGAVTAGAIASLAVSFVLLTFGAAAGLSAVSPWTSASTTATAVAIGSAFWVLLVSLWSFAFGGYMAARLRHPWRGASPGERKFRDQAHGLLSWALAVVLAAMVASMASSSGRTVGNQSPTRIAASDTAVDTILRSARADVPAAVEAQRNEVARIFSTNLGRGDIDAADKQYLVTLVSNRSGLAAPNAERAVTDAFNKFKDTINRARKAGVVMAFIAAASLLAGAAIAWWAAGRGGEDREEGTVWEAFRHHPRPIARTIP